ncbi:MAG: HD-GYP domain-containing protein [Negativicutes bacterium]|nr:HD-GYP domain-containing protein [Negativicutes bacterium]
MSYQVKNTPVRALQSGMVVGKSILSDSGIVILDENAVLTDTLIQRLIGWGVTAIYIKDVAPTRMETVKRRLSKNEVFVAKHAEIVGALKEAFDKIRYLKEVPVDQLTELAGQCVDSLVDSPVVTSQLLRIRDMDDYTFSHSVNVGVTAGIIAKWVGLKGQPVDNLVLAGLLHDTGKTQIPLEILNKPGRFTRAEMAVMQRHTILGYEILKRTGKMSEAVLLAAQQHHERLDGSGYPEQLDGGAISVYANIVAVADVLDAMTSKRVYQTAVTPFSVLQEFSDSMSGKLSQHICRTFMDNMMLSLLGSNVKLSDGSICEVVFIDKDRMDRPKLLAWDGETIDLRERTDLSIESIVDN